MASPRDWGGAQIVVRRTTAYGIAPQGDHGLDGSHWLRLLLCPLYDEYVDT